MTAEMPEPRDWLIRKGGYFYRPNRAGYTTEKDQAGRYTEAEARREAAVEPWHMKAIHESEQPDTPKADGTVSASTHTRAMEALREAERAIAAFNLTKDMIVSGTADSLTLRVSLDVIRGLSAALAKIKEAT